MPKTCTGRPNLTLKANEINRKPCQAYIEDETNFHDAQDLQIQSSTNKEDSIPENSQSSSDTWTEISKEASQTYTLPYHAMEAGQDKKGNTSRIGRPIMESHALDLEGEFVSDSSLSIDASRKTRDHSGRPKVRKNGKLKEQEAYKDPEST